MAHHDNMAYRALDETLEMAAAVDVATRLTSESDTLIVVTGDHSHTMSLSGYGARGNDILGEGRAALVQKCIKRNINDLLLTV